jgi:hypothetical protein
MQAQPLMKLLILRVIPVSLGVCVLGAGIYYFLEAIVRIDVDAMLIALICAAVVAAYLGKIIRTSSDQSMKEKGDGNG